LVRLEVLSEAHLYLVARPLVHLEPVLPPLLPVALERTDRILVDRNAQVVRRHLL
jgi:hypothetical protein